MRARRFVQSLGFTGVLAFSACSSMGFGGSEQSWTMNSSRTVQAATGTVKVDKEKDGNTKVKVEVVHLAPPKDVFHNASAYVVWLQPENGQAQNVGVLRVGDDLKGQLETKTAFKDFKVMVTAEDSPNVTSPSGHQIMDTTITMPS